MTTVSLEIEVVEQLKQGLGGVTGVDAVFRRDPDPEAGAEGLVGETVDDGRVFHGVILQ